MMNMTAHLTRRLYAVMFCAGLYAILAQILLLRELLVAFYGNELTLGAMLSAWLIVIGVGSLAIQPFLRRSASTGLWWLLVVLLLLLAAVLPVQIWLIRIIRIILNVPYGEYVPFAAMLAGTTLVLLPTGLSIGIIFPCACHLRAAEDERAVGRLYAVESLGSLVGGVVFTFVLVQWVTPFAIMAAALLIAMCGAVFAAPRPLARRLLILPILGLAVAVAWPQCLADLERKSLEARWRAFGSLPEPGDVVGEPLARLAASVDSRYQNLALVETQGQMTLYGNGQVLGVFPDPISGELKINFIMAQNPAAESVLLIGGNPVTDIPELLKYPLRRLVHVELDGDISRLLEWTGGREYRQAVRDPRCVRAVADGPRFVKTTGEAFDVIIVDAPEPTTIALNRFYTLDFYQAVRSRLAPGGFMVTSVEASEQLLDEAAALTASVRQSLMQVFPRVLVTGGTRNQYFAGMDNSPLTFDRQTLFQRSAGAGVRHRYFRPEYFLNADEISPDKTAFVQQRLADIRAPANTALRPISTYYQLRLWSRFSGSRLEGFLNGLSRIRFQGIAMAFVIAGAGLLLMGGVLGIWRRRGNALSLMRSDRQKNVLGTSRSTQINLSSDELGLTPRGCAGDVIRRTWTRGMLGLVLASTGCCGMALELILVYVFQSLLGYVYARIGLIVAVFMLGLMLGALTAVRSSLSALGTWRVMLGLDGLLLGLAMGIPLLAKACLYSGILAGSDVWVEVLIDGSILLVGAAVGAQFVVVNRLLQVTGLSQGSSAAQANAVDLFGAAFGGLVVGIVLLPVWGIQAACFLLAAVKAMSLLAGVSMRQAAGSRPPAV